MAKTKTKSKGPAMECFGGFSAPSPARGALRVLIDEFKALPETLQRFFRAVVEKPNNGDLIAILADWLEDGGWADPLVQRFRRLAPQPGDLIVWYVTPPGPDIPMDPGTRHQAWMLVCEKPQELFPNNPCRLLEVNEEVEVREPLQLHELKPGQVFELPEGLPDDPPQERFAKINHPGASGACFCLSLDTGNQILISGDTAVWVARS